MAKYIFWRHHMWYPIDLTDDEDACRNAEDNPGTSKVEDIDGRVVWTDSAVSGEGEG